MEKPSLIILKMRIHAVGISKQRKADRESCITPEIPLTRKYQSLDQDTKMSPTKWKSIIGNITYVARESSELIFP